MSRERHPSSASANRRLRVAHDADSAELDEPVTSERRRFGLRLRELRRLQGLTTRELADRSGVSASLINQLENGKSEATVISLRRIAAGLGLPIAEFFVGPGDAVGGAEDEADNGKRLAHVVRRHLRKRLHIPESNFTFELLTPDLRGSIEFVWFELEPGRPQEESMAHQHPGEEYALVLEGTMHLIIGDEEYVLEAGDSAVFDPSIPHRTENRGTTKLVQISAISPPSF